MHITEKRIEIDAPVARVFDLFSDFESFPRWMKNIREVRYTGRRFTRWAAEAPFGTEVEWEAETTHFEPERRIAWRSVRGDVDTEGEVIFEESGRGSTLMRVVLGYHLPAGRLGEIVARLFGTDPEQQLEDDLERFAQVAEGRRRGARRNRDEDKPEPYAGPRSAPRESQLAGQRRYQAERERLREHHYRRDGEQERQARRNDERRRYEYEGRRPDFMDDVEERRLEGEARERASRDEEGRCRRQQHQRPPVARLTEEEYPRRRRYALTPRERELEREQRGAPDYDYSEEAFRRGVDKLMEETPSRRWRRWD
jgi:uncharacterized protein YndB with AHSA1/START domain